MPSSTQAATIAVTKRRCFAVLTISFDIRCPRGKLKLGGCPRVSYGHKGTYRSLQRIHCAGSCPRDHVSQVCESLAAAGESRFERYKSKGLMPTDAFGWLTAQPTGTLKPGRQAGRLDAFDSLRRPGRPFSTKNAILCKEPEKDQTLPGRSSRAIRRSFMALSSCSVRPGPCVPGQCAPPGSSLWLS